MTPYLRAHAAYHHGREPFFPWPEALDFHLQHGVVIADRHAFLMARMVPPDSTAEFQLALRAAPLLHSSVWHIWILAGRACHFPRLLLQVQRAFPEHGVSHITYQRRGRGPLITAAVPELLQKFQGKAEVPSANRTDP